MFKNKIIRWSTLAMFMAIIAYFFVENFMTSSAQDEIANPQSYIEKVNQERAAKDELFRSGADSPIPNKADFHGLHYFKVNLDYRVKATISPYMKDDKEYIVQYTDSTSEKYERYGYAHFSINNQPQKLLLLKHDGVISVLFRDETSGIESYGGGRYLDFSPSDVKNNSIILDFNKAYNPYCAYEPNFACPLPPAENTMHISIFAGEQMEDANH
jgi:uncharacterized protein (DUF1684 family)